ncbi:WD40/YVTN/BNR-like repeat-containing protein [Azohydromonas australica]|uniref:WD40/YVTN/BNR-like repeat-containing protein n=1 Tax=Azohydromonas australica TaxID=364039 RepID=UPI0004149DA7|nr:YCF48-related protein [Azohydromonas australica]
MKFMSAVLVAGLCAAALPGAAAPVAPSSVDAALQRPAVPARQAARAVLLGAAQAGGRVVAVGERGIVALSDDGGTSWHQALTPVSVTLTAVRFADAQRGYAVGHGGTVLTTVDGGQSWTLRLDGRRIAQIEFEAARVSGDAAALKSAQALQADGPDKPLLDVLVMDAKRVLVVGAYGLALYTGDGGASWSSWRARMDNPKELHLYALRQRGSHIVVAGEQGLLLQSTDAGQSFRQLDSPYKGSFFTAELPSEHEIVVAGLRGNVWRSRDGGTTWAQLSSPVPVSITASALRSDGSLIFANQAGMVLGARDVALQPLSSGALPPLSAVLPLGSGSVLALSIQGARRVELQAPTQAQKGQTP